MGKSTLSLLGDDALDKAIGKLKFTQFTNATITDAKAFKKDILTGRQRGYFLSQGETVADVMGISIACRIGGEPYALGVAGPTSRLKENFDAYLTAIKESEVAVARIELEISYFGHCPWLFIRADLGSPDAIAHKRSL